MNEREMADYYERRKGDVSLWEDKPSKAKVRRGTVVFCIRLAKEELELLQQRAQERGTTVSGFIRRAALDKAQPVVVEPTITLTPTGPARDFFAVAMESVTTASVAKVSLAKAA